MKNIALTIFLSFSVAILLAQPLNVSTPAAMTKAAEQALEEGNPYAAYEFYEKIYKDTKDKVIYAKLGELNYELRDYDKATRYLGRLVTRDRKKEWTEYKYLYAMALKNQGNYQEAIDNFEDYALQGADEAKVKLCKLEIEGCKMAKTLKADENLKIGNLGKSVNTKQTEGSPVLSEGVLYYSSLNAKEIIELNKAKDWQAKIYTANQASDGYENPTALGQEINREGYHQGNVFVTKDGKVMYFTRVILESHRMTESKIFYSRNNGGVWGASSEVNGVNGEYLAKHPCIGELFGEKVMFFVANIPGGQGGDDIYYAPRKEDGLFGAPVNLGKGINTAGQEATPYYTNGKLYFSSNGYPSLGGLDVLSSTWNGSTWSAPTNLGPGVNSPVDDFFFTSAEDQKSGFFVSNREGENNLKSKTCCDDMYAWEIEQVKVSLNAMTYRFKTKSEKKLKENPPLEACTLQLFDVTDKSPSKTDTRNNPTGNDFHFTLLPEKEYVLIATRDGYQNDTTILNTVGITKSKSMDKTLTLRRDRKEEPEPVEPDSIVITKNETIRLNNIYYDYNDDKILTDSEEDLYTILGLMNQYSDMVIELSSHTDSRGKEAYNQDLSQRRANSARKWLMNKGVDGSRIKPVGYGESQILNRCTEGVECSDEEHRFNRRTEFKIISGPTTITIKKMEVRPRSSSGSGAGGKQSWNSAIYDILMETGYYPSDTIVPSAESAKKKDAASFNPFLDEMEDEAQVEPQGAMETYSVESSVEVPVAPVEASYMEVSSQVVEQSPSYTDDTVVHPEENMASYPPAVEAVEAAVAHKAETLNSSQVAKSPAVVMEKEVKKEAIETVETSTQEWANPADQVMVFKSKKYDFGKIKSGEKVEKLYMFTNTGEEALVMEVVSACDCIQLDYTRTLIEKGQSGNISIVYDSNEQFGKIHKSIDIIFGNADAKGYPLIQQLELTGIAE